MLIPTDAESPTIVILDTHPVMRMGLAKLLRENLDRFHVIEAKNLSDFRQDVNQSQLPNLFILVINEDFEEETFDPVSEVKKHFPSAFLIVYGEEIQPDIVIDYLKSGVSGYLSKRKDLIELVTCVQTVMGGKRYLSPDHMEFLLGYLIENYKTLKKQDILTPRQNQIANYLIQGLTTSSIAEKTGLHMSTISTFKAAIFAKLGVDNALKLKEILQADENHRPG